MFFIFIYLKENLFNEYQHWYNDLIIHLIFKFQSYRIWKPIIQLTYFKFFFFFIFIIFKFTNMIITLLS